MKNLLGAIVLGIMASPLVEAGYGGCDVKPEYHNAKTEEFILYWDCADGMQETVELPKGMPTHMDVVGFDPLNIGRKIIRSSLRLEIDGNLYAEKVDEANKKKFDDEHRAQSTKEMSEYLEFWTKRGFTKGNFVKLKRNNQLSKTSEKQVYSYYEIYDWPGTEAKFGWKMKISNGKIKEGFKVFLLKDGVEVPLADHPPPPNWTFTGGRTFNAYTDAKNSFLLAIFSDTWGGIYYWPGAKLHLK